MVEGQVNRAVAVADADDRCVVRVIGFDLVVFESDDFPLALGKLPAADANVSLSIKIGGVLPAAIGRDGRLLVGPAVDGGRKFGRFTGRKRQRQSVDGGGRD